MYASYEGRLEVVTALMAAGADATAVDQVALLCGIERNFSVKSSV
jgi:hypothetical protein